MFCSDCGKSTGGVATAIKKAAVAEVFEKPVDPPEPPAPDLDINTFVTPPPPPVVPEIKVPKEPKPKTFFGVGALVICLVTIGILATSTGVFAALYINAII